MLPDLSNRLDNNKPVKCKSVEKEKKMRIALM